MYEKGRHMNPTLLELAKLNFNIVQATLQTDLREISRWWRNLGMMDNLNFTRDRLVESFLCSVGVAFEPQHRSLRKWLTKVIMLILIIDDVYDIYGSLEELKQFTDAVDRWDSKEIKHLPECMKICFQALHDIVNEIAYEIQQEIAWDQVLIHLKKVWADFCKALFVEATWYSEGHVPSLEEYLSNALISSSGAVLAIHSFLAITHEVTAELVEFLAGSDQDLVYNQSLIIRLCNDLGTSKVERERGDAPSSILCYQREANISEEEAEKHIKSMINQTWKKLNEQFHTKSPSLQPFVNISLNIARTALSLYQYEDGFGIQDRETRSKILRLLVEPLKLDY